MEPRQDPDLGIGKGDTGDGRRRPDGPLDGSTSGTIGGGGKATGGSAARQPPPEMPDVNPEDAASGRGAPDPLDAATPPDDLGPGATDVAGD
jgi:hypothetical protein